LPRSFTPTGHGGLSRHFDLHVDGRPKEGRPAGYDAALALAELHETWEAYDESERSFGGGRYGGWHDDDDEDEDDDEGGLGSTSNYELEALIDSEITLDRWRWLRGDEVGIVFPGVWNSTAHSTMGEMRCRICPD
jgi:hypothetical protein